MVWADRFGYIDRRTEETVTEDMHKLTEDECELLYYTARAEQEKFEKRLNTYLKRYGLSKCHYWTYWLDA